MFLIVKYMKHTLLGLFFLCSILINAQDVIRVKVDGRIMANDNDVENVTIFNTSSNLGTITDADGQFTISLAVNDVLEISALQFEKIKITITEETIASKKLTIFLVEHINRLNEVLILPYGLSGNMNVDLESVKTFNPDLDAIYFGVNNIDAYEFPDDHLAEVTNQTLLETHRLQYGLNFGAIFGLLTKEVFKGNKEQNQGLYPNTSDVNKNLIDTYSHAYISGTFNIPEDRVNEFIAYVENEDMDYSLFEDGNEMQLLEYLVDKSKEFLNSSGGKD